MTDQVGLDGGETRIATIIRAVVIVAALAVLGLYATAYLTVTTHEVNRLRAGAEAIAKLQADRAAGLALDYATWDEARENLAPQPQLPWVEENLGRDMVDQQGVVRALVVRSDGSLVVHVEAGEVVESPRAAPNARALEGLARLLLGTTGQDGAGSAVVVEADKGLVAGLAPILGHTPEVRSSAAADPLHLILFRNLDLTDFKNIAEGSAEVVRAAFAPEEVTTPLLGNARILVPLAGPEPSPLLVLEARLPSRSVILNLGLPFGLIGLGIIAAGFWAARIVARDAVNTSRLEAQRRALEDSRRRLLEVSEAKARYTRMLADELRAPLSVITSMAEFLGRKATGAGGAGGGGEQARIIVLATTQMRQLIDDLLFFARAEAGALRLMPRQHRLGDVLTPTMEGLTRQAMDVGIRLSMSGIDLDIDVITDERALSRIVGNLVAAMLQEAGLGGGVTLTSQVDGRDLRLGISGRTAGGTAIQFGWEGGDAAPVSLQFCRALIGELGGRVELSDIGGLVIVLPIMPEVPQRGRSSDRIDMLKSYETSPSSASR